MTLEFKVLLLTLTYVVGMHTEETRFPFQAEDYLFDLVFTSFQGE